MTLRDTPPFRADHVGSLLRPRQLLEARTDHAEGRISDEQLRAAEDEAIEAVVHLQQDAGLRTVTDGEFRRTSWHMDFIYGLDGISTADDKVKVSFHNEQGDLEFEAAALHVNGRIGVSETIFGAAFSFLQGCVDGAVPKLTIPSPSMVHWRGGRAAIDEGVPAPVLSTALYERFSSRNEDEFANKLLSAMRKQFGGHDEKPGESK